MVRLLLIVAAAVGAYWFLTTYHGADTEVGWMLLLPTMSALALAVLFD
jgi:hypothetical protein